MNSLSNYQTIAIIGTAKNAGKTTALNALLAKLKHKQVAITSIGLDGEKIDQLTKQEKPSIHAYKGMYVATARDTLAMITSAYQIVEDYPIQTPLGPIVLVEMLEDGDVLLAGPSSLHELTRLKDSLSKYDCDHFFIDGALFRKSSAASHLSDAMILSTGASLHKNMQKVIQDTKILIETISLTKKDLPKIKKTKLVLENSEVIYDQGTFLSKPNDLLSHAEHAKELHIQGAMTNRLIEELIANKDKIPSLEIILNDFTMIHADLDLFQKLHLLKHRVKLINQTPLLLLTINPTSPYFEGFDPQSFEEAMKEALPSTPIIDIKRKELPYE